MLHMTQLLSHTMAHFTGPSFMLKANNQPYKKFRSCIQWSNRCQILQNFDFQSQNYPNLSNFFSLDNINLGAHFLTTSLFKALYFLKWKLFSTEFTQMYSCTQEKKYIEQVIAIQHK